MKLVFLGTGSAFSLENFQSNMLLEASQGRLLIDCGSDVRHSLGKEGKTALDITDVYISHLHADHIGGLEWLGLVNYFARTKDNPALRPRLHIRETLLDDLWQSLHGGMGTLEAHVADLSTYFDLCPIERNGSFSFAGTQLRTVQVVHYYDGYEIVPSYGLLFERNGIPVFITTDTQIHPNQMSEFRARADYIFHDCETAPFESGVHAHYGELATLDDGLKGKLWLYGYQDGAKPDCEADGFLGWVRQGQVFDFENPASFRPARPKQRAVRGTSGGFNFAPISMRERNAALMRKDDPEPDFQLEAAVSLNRKRLRGEAEWVGLKMALPALEEALAVV